MSNSPIGNSLLLAVLTTSATFCGLTTVMSPTKAQSAAEYPPLSSNRRSQLLDSERRSAVIRNVGFCIVASVGAGILVGEANRKWQTARKSAQLKLEQSLLLQSFEDKVAELQVERPAAPSDEELPLTHDLSVERSLVTANVATAEQTDVEWNLPDNAWVDYPANATQVDVPLVEFPRQHRPLRLDDTARLIEFPQADATEEAWLETRRLHSSSQTILESSDQYETCRIKHPQRSHRLFAILFGDSYYRFCKREATKEKALGVATRLSNRGDQAVITQHEDAYVVWTLEPQAIPA